VIAFSENECQKWSIQMIMSKSKPITPGAAIFYGGLIAGTVDAADGVVAYYFIGGLNPIQGSAIHRQRLLWSMAEMLSAEV
jgi:hypothetical protein